MPKLGTYASVIISLILVFNTVTTEATGLNPLDIGKPIFVVPEIDKEPIDITPFSIIKRGNYYADWIISNKTGRIIGYAPWDTSSKRWTLLNMAGEYRGLIYATIGDLKGREHYLLYPEHYLEYLWYDRDNKYTAVMVTSLGGRPKTQNVLPVNWAAASYPIVLAIFRYDRSACHSI